MNINDILSTFGAFMAVLIAVEIFMNIVMYLESEVIHVRLVLDTAVMAAARKVIVLDFKQMTFTEVFSLGAIIASLGLCYFFVAKGTGVKMKIGSPRFQECRFSWPMKPKRSSSAITTNIRVTLVKPIHCMKTTNPFFSLAMPRKALPNSYRGLSRITHDCFLQKRHSWAVP